MASISRTDLQHLAHLARIDLSDAELDLLGPQLSVILKSVASVGEVATADVPGTSHPLPLSNAFRADVVVASLGAAAVLAGAPAAEQDRFRVPRILDEEQ
jgi:aspartyl-tRNA(Asn)/glutamyl-tRNA(Gln) amidotransferase subunit C